MNIEARSFGIFGLGKTGVATYNYLKNTAKHLLCWDDSELTRDSFEQSFNKDILIDIYNDHWKSLDYIIISPGIPNDHNIFLIAAKHNIIIFSDIELFMSINDRSKYILITGTNGKSTTTALIEHILQQNTINAVAGGNLGTAVFQLPFGLDLYVLELSSYHLSLINYRSIEQGLFSTVLASVLLNITPDHLERHKTMENYIEAKKKILLHDGTKIIAIDNPITNDIFKELMENGINNIITASGSNTEKANILCTKIALHDNYYNNISYNLVSNLIGDYNNQNIACSFAVSRLCGISGEEIIEAIKSFKSLPHRNEFVATTQDGMISFYNDSKATNADASIGSISSLDNIYWLAGGCVKENDDFSVLDKEITKIKEAFLFGRDAEIISNYLARHGIKNTIFPNIDHAFSSALIACRKNITQQNSNILLAPAASSLDQFKSFEHRGETFRQLALKYTMQTIDLNKKK